MRRIAVALCLVFFSCQLGSDVAPLEVLQSEKPRDTTPDVPTTELDQLVAGNTEFAFDLQRAALDPTKNAVASPHSISEALAMTWAGARGSTSEEMARTLHFTLPAERFHPAFNALGLALSERSGLKVVNALWGQTEYPFLQPFLDTLKENYGAGLTLLDFRIAFETSRQTINGWVAEQTKGRIQNLIPAGAIDKTTRLVLTNAITFDGEWAVQFDPNATTPGYLRREDGTWAPAKMMHRDGNLLGLDSDELVAVELPYVESNLSMVVIAPKQGTLASFEASLTASRLSAILGSFTTEDSALALPRFKIAQEAPLELSKTLESMGMSSAFSPLTADFSGMADLSKTDGENLYIQAVLHKAFIEVGEKGTEAAAATAVVMGGDAGCVGPYPTPSRRDLSFDRPFVFAIRDVPSGELLFLGHVVETQE